MTDDLRSTDTVSADPRRVRLAALFDFGVAAVVAMILIPQPVVRGAIMSGGATPLTIAIFVLTLFGAMFAFYFAYLAACAATWGRTYPMYLFGVTLESKPAAGPAMGWALGWVVAIVPAILGVASLYDPTSGIPARLSGVITRAGDS